MKNMESIYLKDAQSWRDWLEHNHDKVSGIWLIYYKKRTDWHLRTLIDWHPLKKSNTPIG